MEAFEALRAILAAADKPSEEATRLLQEALSQKPKPKPTKTLADILNETRPPEAPAAKVVDLMTLLQQRAAAAPPPPIKILPEEPSAYAGISRPTSIFGYSGPSPFSKISEAGRKPRKKSAPGWQLEETKKEPVEKLSLLLLKEMGDDYKPHPNSSVEEARFRAGVQDSFELERILKIPRRPSDLAQYPDQTDLYKRPEGTMRLWPIQSAVLIEAAKANGLLGPIGVGHGKCVHGATEVYDTQAGRRRRADELGSFNVATVDRDRRVTSASATAFASGRKSCVAVVLAGGQEVTLSTDHPILTPHGWVHAERLRVGDLVGTPRFMPEPAEPLIISDAELKFVAYMMADGECVYQPSFTKADPKILEDFTATVVALGGTVRDVNSTTCGKARTYAVSKNLRPILARWGQECGARTKRLPPAFYGLSARQVALFLNIFIACDGYICATGIEVGLASEKLIDDLRFLLLRLGIPSRKTYKQAKCEGKLFDAWRISVTDHEALSRLLEFTGTFIGREENTEKLRVRLATTAANTNVDIVPIGRAELSEICDELGFPRRGGARTAATAERMRSCARQFLSCTAGQLVSRNKFQAFCEQFNYKTGKYAWLAQTDLLWERVKTVEPVGEHPVFDLSVPETECFIANNIVVHNTLASLLVGEAMHAKKIVLLVPPQLRSQLLQHDIPMLNKHWKLPLDRLRVVAYSELSNAKTADLLDTIAPDLIVADEAHNLRHASAARTKRFLRYMKEHPECRFVGLSGTITRRSLKDYQHLAELALRKNSPLPNHHPTLMDWAMAIDVSKKEPMPPGALLKLCDDEELDAIADAPNVFDAQTYVRNAFRRRLVETPGVVATEESALGTSLVITGLRPLVPAEVKVAIEDLHKKWVIDDEELVDALSVARVGRQLAGGFYYRWIWPNGQKDYEWLEARKNWNREVREILKRSRKGLDSPLMITNAILRGEFESTTYEAWAKVKDRYKPTPPTEAVWISKFLVEESIRWAHETCSKAAPGIIWYESDAFGREVAKLGDFPFFGPGTKASEELARINAQKAPVIVCSRPAHGTGKNLQQYCRNLFTAPSTGGVDWEQTIARTHRPGQEADDVFVDVFLHTDDMQGAYISAVRDARYIEETGGQKQKLNYARKVNCADDGE